MHYLMVENSNDILVHDFAANIFAQKLIMPLL